MKWIDEVHAFDDMPPSSDDDEDQYGKPCVDSSRLARPPPPSPLTLWLPLDDVSPDRGGLQVLPRLHTLGALPEGPLGSGAHGGDGVGIAEDILVKHLPEAVDYHLKAGQPAAHHPFTPPVIGASPVSSGGVTVSLCGTLRAPT